MSEVARRLLALAACLLALGCGDAESDEPDAEATVDSDASACGDGHSHSHSHSHAHGTDGCADAGQASANDGAADAGGYVFLLPPGVAPPRVPTDNPITPAKIELGRHLFYDERLSDNQTQSCASCHKQELAFTDGLKVGLGSTGESHTRGSMSLANIAYAPTLTWSNPLMDSLEKQSRVPIFGDVPIELGMKSIVTLEQRLRAVPRYGELFARAFPGEPEPITVSNVERALASFERALISFGSPFDRYQYGGDEGALSESAKRGMVFVMTNEDHRFECNHCHGGATFSDHTVDVNTLPGTPLAYHQTGLYNVDGLGGYPEPNVGIREFTGKPADDGKFKAPTLRNIALTAPYMHDGSIATLSEVLDHYAKGGRARMRGRTDDLLQPFPITEQEKADIIAFLESLTDKALITNPAFSDPNQPQLSNPVAAAEPPK